MLSKHRGELIFGLALAFGLKSLVHPDAASVVCTAVFIGLNALDVFFGAAKADAKLIARFDQIEADFRVLKTEQQRMNLAAGIRPFK